MGGLGLYGDGNMKDHVGVWMEGKSTEIDDWHWGMGIQGEIETCYKRNSRESTRMTRAKTPSNSNM